MKRFEKNKHNIDISIYKGKTEITRPPPWRSNAIGRHQELLEDSAISSRGHISILYIARDP